MAKVYYEGPEQFRPLGAWEYFGYSLLYSIPLIGFIMMIIVLTIQISIAETFQDHSYVDFLCSSL